MIYFGASVDLVVPRLQLQCSRTNQGDFVTVLWIETEGNRDPSCSRKSWH